MFRFNPQSPESALIAEKINALFESGLVIGFIVSVGISLQIIITQKIIYRENHLFPSAHFHVHTFTLSHFHKLYLCICVFDSWEYQFWCPWAFQKYSIIRQICLLNIEQSKLLQFLQHFSKELVKLKKEFSANDTFRHLKGLPIVPNHGCH